MNRAAKANDDDTNATAISTAANQEKTESLVYQSRGTDTVTLNRSQVECILQLINQVASITLNAGSNDVATSTATVEHNSSNPSIALVEPFRIVKESTNIDTQTAVDDSDKLSPPLLGPIVRIRGRNASPCSLPGTPIQLPPPDSMKRLSEPFTNPRLHHTSSNSDIQNNSQFTYDVRDNNFNRNNSDFFSPSSSSSSNLASTSVPCFRRYQMNQNLDEWEKKRSKMLEYQAMLDEQRLEREQRKKIQLERQKREEELWDKKLQQQQERIRREFEEEKRKQREKEENVERKRQIVIEALESKSRELQCRKRLPPADTISLMSVDAVLTKTTDCIGESNFFGDPIKRTQSMYEVPYDQAESDTNSTASTKCKQYTDVNVQTDYSLLLTWLFDVKDKKDWEEFFNRQSKSPSTTESATESNEASVVVVDKQREKTLTTSQTLSASPKIQVNSRSRMSPVNGVWNKPSNASVSSSSSSSRPHPFIGPSTSNLGAASAKSRWHAKKNDSIESKSVSELRKRHIEHSKDFKVKGVTAIKDTKNSLADGGNSLPKLAPLQHSNSYCNTLDYFSHGSNYQLSLTPSSPVQSLDGYQCEDEKVDKVDSHKLQLPSIWDTQCAKRQLKNKFHTAIPVNETVIRICSADTSDHRIKSRHKLDRIVLYERKKWQSQENFNLTFFGSMDRDDTCFSGDEDTLTF